MASQTDVVVIGGGIHGAGVAQAVAAAGHSVCLLEQNQIASGTSSKSSKLIHGGLRYLESAQFSLVKECLKEREYLLNNAPHLVELKPFLIPIYRQTQRRPMTIRLGLTLYAMLNVFRASGRFTSVNNHLWSELDGISLDDLQHVFQYWDAQTDDKLLTQAVIASAVSMDCEVIKPGKVTKLVQRKNNWEIEYEQNGQKHSLISKVVVNAAGPWVNQVLGLVASQPTIKSVDLVQGTHIVLEGETKQGIYYLESPLDKRAIFVMPWYGNTLIGTTEKIFIGDPANVEASNEEVEYLLSSVGFYFPKYQNLHVKHVMDKFAGLRVLPAAEGAAFSRPRETSVYEDKAKAEGLFTIYGGKLTAYRATSALVLNQIAHLLPNVKPIADTRFLKLPD